VEGSMGPEPRGGMSPASSEGFGGSGGEVMESSLGAGAIAADKAEMSDNVQGLNRSCLAADTSLSV